ncbi:hypothetical protein XANCAGTX0491_005418 [Xanthoria calcicola]
MQISTRTFDQYTKPVLVGNGVTFTILPIIIVGLRFYARRVARLAPGIDDWCIVVALVLCTAAGVVLILAAEIGGLGQHQQLGPGGELIHTAALTTYEKCRYINEIITTLNLGLVKISILLFYRRIFAVRPFKAASAVMMTTVACWAVAFTSAMAAQCNPVPYFWESFEIDYPKNCLDVQKMYQALAWSDLALDILVLALPIPVVASLQLPWRTKIKVIDILMLGSVVLASGIARLTSFMQVVDFTNHNPEAYFKDTPYITAGPLFWLFAENAIAIIGACLPTLAPLWSRERLTQYRTGSYVRRVWPKSNSKSYDELERPYRVTIKGEHASNRHLVGLGPATSVTADDVALEDRPRNGINVQTTLFSSYVR